MTTARERVTPVDVTVSSVALTILATSAAMAVLWWAREAFIRLSVKAFCDRVEDLKPVGELLGE